MALNVWPVKAVERRAIRKANYLANKDLFAVEPVPVPFPAHWPNKWSFPFAVSQPHPSPRGLFVRCPEVPQSFEFKLHGSLIASHIQFIEYTSIWCEPVKDVEPVLLLVQGTLFQPEKLHCSQGLGIIAVLGVNVVICYLF